MGPALQHLVQQCHGNSRPCAANGVAESDRAAIDVQSVAVKMQIAVAGQHLGGEGFVQFNQIKILEPPSTFREQLLHGGNGTDSHHPRVNSSCRIVRNARQGLDRRSRGPLLRNQDQRGGCIGDTRGVSRRDRPALGEYRWKLSKILGCGFRTWVLVHFERALALLLPDRGRYDLLREAA